MTIATAACSSGFALLRPATRPQLDATRIATLSGTLALNALALGMLLMPISIPPTLAVADADKAPDFHWIDPPPPKPPLPPVDARITPKPPAATPQPTLRQPQPVTTTTTAATVDAPVLVEQGIYTPPAETGPTTTGPDIITPPSVVEPVSLAIRDNPAPTYPRAALQRGYTGTVVLEILVGVDGVPVSVRVVDGSGHRELDEAARAQVLKRWRFHPAMVDGRAVQARGRVPIHFSLER